LSKTPKGNSKLAAYFFHSPAIMYTGAGPYSGNAPVYPIRVIKIIFYSYMSHFTPSTISVSICSFIIYFILCFHTVHIFYTNFADLLSFNSICLDQTKLFFCSSFARIEETICKESHSPWDTSITAYFFGKSCSLISQWKAPLYVGFSPLHKGSQDYPTFVSTSFSRLLHTRHDNKISIENHKRAIYGWSP